MQCRQSSLRKVAFEPKARTHWHTHPKGQILIVTEGRGYAQKRGEPIQLLLPGDIVTFAPNEEHWHGATAGNMLTHIAIQPVSDEGGDTAWLGPVTEQEYNSYQIL
jgi:4-carboxymuconolactone decarboxylase